HRATAEYTIRGDSAVPIDAFAAPHEFAGREKLGNQPIECLADPAQRRDALFVQFPGNAIVRFGRPPHAVNYSLMPPGDAPQPWRKKLNRVEFSTPDPENSTRFNFFGL